MRTSLIQRLIPSLCCVVLLAFGSPSHAGQILGFPNGLSGWSSNGDAGTVTVSGGLATIAESTFALETDLYLTFTAPVGARSLQFTLNSVFADSTLADNTANGYLPDAFGASLLNPTTQVSLVPTVDASTDSFYTRDIVDGVTQGSQASGVTVSSLSGALASISVDLSSVNLGGQSAEILFRLIGGTDPGSESTVTISNVIVNTPVSVVPEPSSIISALTAGAILVAGYLGVRLLPGQGRAL